MLNQSAGKLIAALSLTPQAIAMLMQIRRRIGLRTCTRPRAQGRFMVPVNGHVQRVPLGSLILYVLTIRVGTW